MKNFILLWNIVNVYLYMHTNHLNLQHHFIFNNFWKDFFMKVPTSPEYFLWRYNFVTIPINVRKINQYCDLWLHIMYSISFVLWLQHCFFYSYNDDIKKAHAIKIYRFNKIITMNTYLKKNSYTEYNAHINIYSN